MSRNGSRQLLYTDGSQEYNKAGNPSGTGAGWVIQWVGSWFSKGGTALGTTQEVYDAEAYAMTYGFEIVGTHQQFTYALII